MQSGLTSTYENQPYDLSSLRALEKKLAKRLGEGVERLGLIIKDVAKNQRRLESRMVTLEIKVLGTTAKGETSVRKHVIDKENKDRGLNSAKGASKRAAGAS